MQLFSIRYYKIFPSTYFSRVMECKLKIGNTRIFIFNPGGVRLSFKRFYVVTVKIHHHPSSGTLNMWLQLLASFAPYIPYPYLHPHKDLSRGWIASFSSSFQVSSISWRPSTLRPSLHCWGKIGRPDKSAAFLCKKGT